MSQDTNLSNLVINKLTKAQYNEITPSDTELYFLTDDNLYLAADQGTANVGKILTVGSDGIVVPQNVTFIGNYTNLINKPSINSVILTGNKTAAQLGFATVSTTGSYNDLTDKPTIPAAQQQVNWNATSGITSIANKPSLATIATSGDYTDLSNKPTINDLTTSVQQAALNSGATSTNIAQITTNQTDISTINGKIPSAASSSNQLADKAFVNSSISNMAANYVTSDAQGDNFATHAALLAGPYYYKGQSYTLTNNDYALVESDEDHSNATTRYVYDGAQWAFQYIVNNAPFTQAQLDAINSTITSTLVSDYSTHIADTDIHVTALQKTTWSGKQDALVSGTNIKTINSTSLLGSGDISIPALPSQSGNTGKFLTTDGTDASWATLATVATSGSYTDLTNTPAVYTKTETDTLLNNKVTTGHEIIEFQAPTAANNYTWYRKYKDGWVEQGGRTNNFTNTAVNTGNGKSVTLSIAMTDTKYVVTVSKDVDLTLGNGSIAGWANRQLCVANQSTTGFTLDEYNIAAANGTSIIGTWYATGKHA